MSFLLFEAENIFNAWSETGQGIWLGGFVRTQPRGDGASTKAEGSKGRDKEMDSKPLKKISKLGE